MKRKYINKLLNIKPVDPNQKYSIICDIIDMIQIIWQFILVTMTTLYGMDDSHKFYSITKLFSIVYLFFDIFNQVIYLYIYYTTPKKKKKKK